VLPKFTLGFSQNKYWEIRSWKKMVILFLIALLFAWPTGGLSLLAYFALLGVRSYLKAKVRMNYANTKRAERSLNGEKKTLPSWIADKDEIAIFIETIQKAAQHKGVPIVFLQALLGNNDTLMSLVNFAGAMELEGSSFLEQQVAVTDRLVAYWNEAPLNVRLESLNS